MGTNLTRFKYDLSRYNCLFFCRLFDLQLSSFIRCAVLFCYSAHTSSETQGQLVGPEKSLNGREKISGEEKSRRLRRTPGDKVLTDQFQTVGVILASDWCQKTFVFFCPIQSSKTRSRFASSYTIDTSRPLARHMFT